MARLQFCCFLTQPFKGWCSWKQVKENSFSIPYGKPHFIRLIPKISTAGCLSQWENYNIHSHDWWGTMNGGFFRKTKTAPILRSFYIIKVWHLSRRFIQKGKMEDLKQISLQLRKYFFHCLALMLHSKLCDRDLCGQRGGELTSDTGLSNDIEHCCSLFSPAT